MRHRSLRRLLALLMLLLYVCTPYMAMGYSVGCACVHGAKVCGVDGFICCCCEGTDDPFDITSYSRCKRTGEFDLDAQPLGDMLMLSQSSLSTLGIDTFFIRNDIPIEGVHSPLLHPPRTLRT